MAVRKLLKVGPTGLPTEEAAISTSSGVGDADKFVQTNLAGVLDITLFPTSIGQDVRTVTAGENLSAGNLIYMSAAGTVFKADANAEGKEATGFVLTSITAAASGTAYFGGGVISGLSGLTAGARYFLSNSATGAVALYASLTFGAADIVQQVGRALSTTELYFEPQSPILVA
jgi:hypothetical protein